MNNEGNNVSGEKKKTFDKGMLVTIIAVVIVVAIAIIGTIASEPKGNATEASSAPTDSSTPVSQDENSQLLSSDADNSSSQTDSGHEENSKPQVSSSDNSAQNNRLGVWGNGVDCGGYYEREVTIKRITEDGILFDIFYYRLWGGDGIYASFSNNKAYFNTAEGVSGYISFSGDGMTLTITESFDESLVETGTFSYFKK